MQDDSMQDKARDPLANSRGPEEEPREQAEYVLLVALVAIAAVNALIVIGGDLRAVFDSALGTIAAITGSIG